MYRLNRLTFDQPGDPIIHFKLHVNCNHLVELSLSLIAWKSKPKRQISFRIRMWMRVFSSCALSRDAHLPRFICHSCLILAKHSVPLPPLQASSRPVPSSSVGRTRAMCPCVGAVRRRCLSTSWSSSLVQTLVCSTLVCSWCAGM